MEMLLDGYISPFGMDLDKVKLVNLISSAPVDDAVAESLLHAYDNGKYSSRTFPKRAFGQ